MHFSKACLHPYETNPQADLVSELIESIQAGFRNNLLGCKDIPNHVRNTSKTRKRKRYDDNEKNPV